MSELPKEYSEVRYYAPTAGGCFMCLYDKPGQAICKYGKDRQIAVERLELKGKEHYERNNRKQKTHIT